MNLLLIAPLLMSIVGGVLAFWVPRFATPRHGVTVMTAAALMTAAAIASALVLVVLAAVAEVEPAARLLHWCQALIPGEPNVSPWAGTLAAVALAWSALRVRNHLRHVSRERRRFGEVAGLEITESRGPIAVAVPGNPGGVVLGRDLLAALRPNERSAVLAHERAHLRHGHHRYVLTAEICSAAFPLLRPLARQVRFNTERWADECAATHVGSRDVVARAIARAALMSNEPAVSRLTLALIGSGTVDRVEALRSPATPHHLIPTLVVIGAAMAAAVAGASAQVHHLAAFVLHLCFS